MVFGGRFDETRKSGRGGGGREKENNKLLNKRDWYVTNHLHCIALPFSQHSPRDIALFRMAKHIQTHSHSSKWQSQLQSQSQSNQIAAHSHFRLAVYLQDMYRCQAQGEKRCVTEKRAAKREGEWEFVWRIAMPPSVERCNIRRFRLRGRRYSAISNSIPCDCYRYCCFSAVVVVVVYHLSGVFVNFWPVSLANDDDDDDEKESE